MKKAMKLLKEPDETYTKHYEAIMNKLKNWWFWGLETKNRMDKI
jgi:hypothetical protein